MMTALSRQPTSSAEAWRPSRWLQRRQTLGRPPLRGDVLRRGHHLYTAGQPIGLILATSAGRAAEGARAVKVEYYGLPAIFTMEEAIEKESFFSFFKEIKKGDPEEGFKNCDHAFTGVARIGG
ncbi:hypothetical protein B0T26DRAFT_490495 [Lasiosphaeria miniovina]|uniref:Uncharacterized protein n=1 Tax=Lasiosphaeria miniovina TaxID=1954250 RepID=A0AA40DHA5_9PEZI|nr:uncharacterized protein B0T26DRAFT_490495 [Lasiosphaeria miniovina]KAK0703100.1 hypothetical protein B0T26DRAFT_490495 [Lasiosphaeria miniovina]